MAIRLQKLDRRIELFVPSFTKKARSISNLSNAFQPDYLKTTLVLTLYIRQLSLRVPDRKIADPKAVV